jgi:hypothetical protein
LDCSGWLWSLVLRSYPARKPRWGNQKEKPYHAPPRAAVVLRVFSGPVVIAKNFLRWLGYANATPGSASTVCGHVFSGLG